MFINKKFCQNLIKMALKAKQQIFRERIREEGGRGRNIQGDTGLSTPTGACNQPRVFLERNS